MKTVSEYEKIRDLCIRYATTLIEIQFQFPGMPLEQIERMAKSFMTAPPATPAATPQKPAKVEEQPKEPAKVEEVKAHAKEPAKVEAQPPSIEPRTVPCPRETYDMILKVMGNETLHADEIYRRMKAAGWKSERYTQPQRYLSDLLLRLAQRSDLPVPISRVEPCVYKLSKPEDKLPDKSRKPPRGSMKAETVLEIARILGDDAKNVNDIYWALKSAGRLPDSNDPKAYIGNLLWHHESAFEPVLERGKGYYRNVKAANARPNDNDDDLIDDVDDLIALMNKST